MPRGHEPRYALLLDKAKDFLALCVLAAFILWKTYGEDHIGGSFMLERRTPAAVDGPRSVSIPLVPARRAVDVPVEKPSPIVPDVTSDLGTLNPPSSEREPTPYASAASQKRRSEAPLKRQELLASVAPRTAYYQSSTPSGSGNAALPHVGVNDTQRATALLGDGIHKFWNGQYRSAIERFNAAYRLNPNDAACLYFLALSHKRSGEPTLAKRTLVAAASEEAGHPLPNFGRLMERVQGDDRLWIEEARSLIGVAR